MKDLNIPDSSFSQASTAVERARDDRRHLPVKLLAVAATAAVVTLGAMHSHDEIGPTHDPGIDKLPPAQVLIDVEAAQQARANSVYGNQGIVIEQLPAEVAPAGPGK